MPRVTNNKKVVRRLGERLQHIYDWIAQCDPYDEIWDLCCDHGRLGLHLHQAHPKADIHLVDRVASIIDILRDHYQYLDDGRLFFKHECATHIRLQPHKRQVIVLAGIGGGSAIGILKVLLDTLARTTNETPYDGGPPSHSPMSIDFILSPNSHIFELRKFLGQHPLKFKKEAFVCEKGRCHEHILLSYSPQKSEHSRVSPLGEAIWQPFNATKARYLNALMQHYQRVVLHQNKAEALAALSAYSELALELQSKPSPAHLEGQV
ncbi:MAG: tRNA (adenine22-N1)-methyltransferase [Lentisphaeria bacterium]|jgi:tRNA (adenine22-N1)-methyltransferase